jgi:hypothetical protein
MATKPLRRWTTDELETAIYSSSLDLDATGVKELAVWAEVLSKNEGKPMHIFMALAITMAAAIGLGGCFWHHQAAVVTQPAPPLK